jgi:hypothetical protein
MQNAEFRLCLHSAFWILHDERRLSLQPLRSRVDHPGLRRAWSDAEWVVWRGSRRSLIVVVDASVNWRRARDRSRRQPVAFRHRLWRRHADARRQLRLRALPNRERRWSIIIVVDDG